jgi:hypothetical protein
MRIAAHRIAMVATLSFLLAAPSASAQEREWTFSTGEEDAYLVFGVPETDDVGVSFWCTIGMGEIKVYLPEAGDQLKSGQKVPIEIHVNGGHFDFSGEAAPNEEAGTMSAEVHIEASHRMFDALFSADRFTVKMGKEESVFPLQGTDFESLRRVCSRH